MKSISAGLIAVVGVFLMGTGPCEVFRPVVDGGVYTPAVMTWVNPDAGLSYPYAFYWDGNGGSPIYVDPTTGYAWSISNLHAGAPTLEGTTFENGIFFTTANCTGQTYLLVRPNEFPGLVYTAEAAGQYWASSGFAGTLTAESTMFDGICYTSTLSGAFSYGVGPLTPPTLPAGPWSLQVQ